MPLRVLAAHQTMCIETASKAGCDNGQNLGCSSQDNAACFGPFTVHYEGEELIPYLLHLKEARSCANVSCSDFCSNDMA